MTVNTNIISIPDRIEKKYGKNLFYKTKVLLLGLDETNLQDLIEKVAHVTCAVPDYDTFKKLSGQYGADATIIFSTTKDYLYNKKIDLIAYPDDKFGAVISCSTPDSGSSKELFENMKQLTELEGALIVTSFSSERLTQITEIAKEQFYPIEESSPPNSKKPGIIICKNKVSDPEVPEITLPSLEDRKARYKTNQLSSTAQPPCPSKESLKKSLHKKNQLPDSPFTFDKF